MSETTFDISNKNYSEEELHQLWGTSTKRLTTYLWLSAVIRTESRHIYLTNSDRSVSANKCRDSKQIVHAEYTALRDFELSEGFNRISEIPAKNSILDLAFWITNSPCIECRNLIMENMKQIHSLNPEMNLRILLFFSSLYCNGLSADTALSQLADWIIELITQRISVIIGPIIVTKMVPEPPVKQTKINRIQERRKRDIHSLVSFWKLRRIIRSSLSGKHFVLKSSHYRFEQGPLNIFQNIAAKNPFYLSLSSPDNPQLSSLNPVIGLFICLIVYCFV